MASSPEQCIIDALQRLNTHTRLPPSLEKAFPEAAAAQKKDVDRSFERLRVIETVLGGRELGEGSDLGGNSGYFSLSLLDSGLLKKATVYDISLEAIEVGRIMAQQMGLSGSIRFFSKAIDLDFVRKLPPVDTLLCLNLLHHAGQRYDREAVQVKGWEEYASQWLLAMRDKCRQAVISVGFETRQPCCWDIPRSARPERFARIAERAGWSILYDANIRDLCRLGIKRSNGRCTQEGIVVLKKSDISNIDTVLKEAEALIKKSGLSGGLRGLRRALEYHIKPAKYHIYVLEQ